MSPYRHAAPRGLFDVEGWIERVNEGRPGLLVIAHWPNVTANGGLGRLERVLLRVARWFGCPCLVLNTYWATLRGIKGGEKPNRSELCSDAVLLCFCVWDGEERGQRNDCCLYLCLILSEYLLN